MSRPVKEGPNRDDPAVQRELAEMLARAAERSPATAAAAEPWAPMSTAEAAYSALRGARGFGSAMAADDLRDAYRPARAPAEPELAQLVRGLGLGDGGAAYAGAEPELTNIARARLARAGAAADAARAAAASVDAQRARVEEILRAQLRDERARGVPAWPPRRRRSRSRSRTPPPLEKRANGGYHGGGRKSRNIRNRKTRTNRKRKV